MDFDDWLARRLGHRKEQPVKKHEVPDHVDEEALRLALAMDGEPNCATCAQNTGEEETATWVCFLAPHGDDCDVPDAWPMCDDCKRVAKTAHSLRHWPGFGPAECEDCGTPVTFTHYVPITAYL